MNSFIKRSREYAIITEFYKGKRAKRSNLLYMNHINEGLYILSKMGASYEAHLGYCLHPLVQGDDDFVTNRWLLESNKVNKEAVYCALEFRNIANQYLSGSYSGPEDVISLSPLTAVNDMLYADKIQNYKDFLIHHKSTHPRSKELNQYFQNWFTRLRINDFDEWNEELTRIFK